MQLHDEAKNQPQMITFSFDEMQNNIKNASNEIGLFSENQKLEYVYFCGSDNVQKHVICFQYENSAEVYRADLRQTAFIIFGETYNLMLSSVFSLFEIMAEKLKIENDEERLEKTVTFVNDILRMAIFKSFFFDVAENQFFILGTETVATMETTIDPEPVKNYFAEASQLAQNEGLDLENLANQ